MSTILEGAVDAGISTMSCDDEVAQRVARERIASRFKPSATVALQLAKTLNALMDVDNKVADDVVNYYLYGFASKCLKELPKTSTEYKQLELVMTYRVDSKYR